MHEIFSSWNDLKPRRSEKQPCTINSIYSLVRNILLLDIDLLEHKAAQLLHPTAWARFSRFAVVPQNDRTVEQMLAFARKLCRESYLDWNIDENLSFSGGQDTRLLIKAAGQRIKGFADYHLGNREQAQVNAVNVVEKVQELPQQKRVPVLNRARGLTRGLFRSKPSHALL